MPLGEVEGEDCCGRSHPTPPTPQGDLRPRWFFVFVLFFPGREPGSRMVHLKALFKSGPFEEWGGMGLGKVGWFLSLTQVSPASRGMASTPTRNEEKKGSRMSQAATPLGGGLVSMGMS